MSAPRRAFDAILVSLAERLVEVRPLDPFPGWTFGAGGRGWRASARKLLWKVGDVAHVRRPVIVPWYNGMSVQQHLGNDLSRCLYVGGTFEPNELAFLAETLHPGDTFIDVGANEGLYSVLAASIVGPEGHVVAVEPSSRERARLEANLVRNSLDNVVTMDCALAAESGSAALQVADARHAGHNSLGEFAYSGVGVTDVEQVSTMTMDELVDHLELARVDLVKIDVEGSESRVLRGATRTLAHERPILMLELQEKSLRSLGSSRSEVLDLLSDNRYEVRAFSDTTGRPSEPASSRVELNIVAVPSERV